MAWKIVQKSGGVKIDFSGLFATEKEAEERAEFLDWEFIDENEFHWQLDVEEV